MKSVTATCLVLLLSGCAASSSLRVASTPSAEVEASGALSPQIQNNTETLNGTALGEGDAEDSISGAQMAPTLGLDGVYGETPQKIVETFGSAAFVRRDGEVQMYQFMSSTCYVDVYFYREGIGQAFLAQHVDLRMSQGGEEGDESLNPKEKEQSCLASFFPNQIFPVVLVSSDAPTPESP